MTTDRTQAEAREELRRRAEGAMADSIGAALDYLAGDDAADLIEAAGLGHLSPRRLLAELTGVTA
jgi:hypothetical protein